AAQLAASRGTPNGSEEQLTSHVRPDRQAADSRQTAAHTLEHRRVFVGADDRAARSGEFCARAGRARGLDHVDLPLRQAVDAPQNSPDRAARSSAPTKT